jgi:hypothetical protein
VNTPVIRPATTPVVPEAVALLVACQFSDFHGIKLLIIMKTVIMASVFKPDAEIRRMNVFC